jgi:hypothetical protein
VSGERSFPRGRPSLIDLMAAWREVARQVASLPPDTPEWQQIADEARRRRTRLDADIADTWRVQRDFREHHPRPRTR